MTDESVSATLMIDAAAEVVFGVLADPSQHVAIDGTGWVGAPLDREPLTAAGQIFRMAMYHPNHPDGDYRMANRVQVFDPPSAISWQPGYYAEDGSVRYAGWSWRYDLAAAAPGGTEVTLTYDWSAVGESVRARIPFPPFGSDHLANSLAHLATLCRS